MNKLIQEYAQRAGLAWAEDVGCGFPDIKYPPGYEKFAHLIILRCLKEIRDVHTDFFDLRMSTDDFSEKIRLHAGEMACNRSIKKIEELFAIDKYDF